MEHAAPLSREQLAAQLRAVQSSVERSRRPVMTPPSIALYWGTATLVGFSMLDFAPNWSGPFWMVAAPLGGVYSHFMAKRLERKYGETDSLEGWREVWHWMGMAGCLMLLLLPAIKNRITPFATAQLSLLIVAYTYFHAWVRRGDLVVLVAGGVMVAGYVALNWISTYTWTIVGASVFVAMAVGSLVAWRATARHMTEAGEA